MLNTPIIDVIELMAFIETFLGLTLSASSRQQLESYCRNLAYDDPQHAFDKIIAELEKITKKKLTANDKEKLEEIKKHNKWRYIWEKDHDRVVVHRPRINFNIDQIKTIIDAAAKRLKINLKPKQEQALVKYYKKYEGQVDTVTDKANMALLGVIKVGIAGGVRIVVQYNWGNLFNIQDVNPYHGTAPIDQANAIDYSYGADPTGTEFRAVLNLLKSGGLRTEIMQILQKYEAPAGLKVITKESAPTRATIEPTTTITSPTLSLRPKAIENEAND